MALKIQRKILLVFLNLTLIIFSLSTIFPLIWMFYSSLKAIPTALEEATRRAVIEMPKDLEENWAWNITWWSDPVFFGQ